MASHFFSALGVGAVVLGAAAAFWPSETSKAWVAVSLCITVAAVLFAGFKARPKSIEAHFDRPSMSIRVVVGDLLAQETDAVIGMTTTFDTATPNIIAPSSLQGQLLVRVFGSDGAALDEKLDGSLASTLPTGHIEKPGKMVAYPVGTVATVEEGGRTFYCLAYSEMSVVNEAQASVDGLWSSLSSLWDEVRATSNGEPVAVPVIGRGQSRISQVLPAADSLRLIALSFALAARQKKVCDRLDIVVQEEQARRFDMPEIQSFLDSL